MKLAVLLALCGVLAIGTPEALAKKGGKGNKHQGGVVGLPPGHGGVPPGHGGIPPGQAKKLYGYAPSYTYPTPIPGGYVSQGYSGGYGVPSQTYYGQGGPYQQGGGYSSYGAGSYDSYDPGGPSGFYQPPPSGGRVDFSGTLIWQSQGYSPPSPYAYPYP